VRVTYNSIIEMLFVGKLINWEQLDWFRQFFFFFNIRNNSHKVFKKRKIGKVARKIGKFGKNWNYFFVNNWTNFANLTYLGRYLHRRFAVWVDPTIWMLAKTTLNPSIAQWLKSYLCRSAVCIGISIVTDGNRLEAHREGILIKIVIFISLH